MTSSDFVEFGLYRLDFNRSKKRSMYDLFFLYDFLIKCMLIHIQNNIIRNYLCKHLLHCMQD